MTARRYLPFLASLLLIVTLAPAASADDLIDGVATYETGDDFAPINQLRDRVRQSLGDPDREAEVAARIARMLEHEDAQPAGLRLALDEFRLVATAEHVPLLAELLNDPDLSHGARAVLEGVDDPAVDVALLDQLDALHGEQRIGLIGTIGQRRIAEVDEQLIAHLQDADADPAVREAATAALGHIGTEASLRALMARADDAGGFGEADAGHLLNAADAAVREGRIEQARRVYYAIWTADDAPLHLRRAALAGFVNAGGERGPQILARIVAEDEQLRREAARHLQRLEHEEASQVLLRLTRHEDAGVQRIAIDALGERRDRAASERLAELLASDDASIRTAAADALGKVGGTPRMALALARLAAHSDGDGREMARTALARFEGEGVNAALVRTLHAAEAGSAVDHEILRALGDRVASEHLDDLLTIAAEHDDAAYRRLAMASVANVAEAGDLSAVLDRLIAEDDAQVRQEATRTAITLIRRYPDEPGIASALAEGHDQAAGEARLAVLRLPRYVGGDRLLELVTQAAQSDDAAVRDAAIRTLAEWPDAHATDALLDLAGRLDDSGERQRVFEGFVRVAGLDSDRDAGETVDLYARAFDAARTPDEQRRLLNGLRDVPHPGALDLIEPYIDDEHVGDEAQQAADRIRDALD